MKTLEGKQRGEREVKRNFKVNIKCNARWKRRREITYKKYGSRRRENTGKATGRRWEGERKRGTKTGEAEKKKMAKKDRRETLWIRRKLIWGSNERKIRRDKIKFRKEENLIFAVLIKILALLLLSGNPTSSLFQNEFKVSKAILARRCKIYDLQYWHVIALVPSDLRWNSKLHH